MTSQGLFIAVHAGAGFHRPEYDQRTKQALQLACARALQHVLSQPEGTDAVGEDENNEALTAVEQAITSLEDDPHLNAGYGSNLTIDGTVECDAAIFTGRDNGHFGSIGAVSGIKNPISAARKVLEHSQHSDKLGRVPPMMLVSEGAVNFARVYSPASIFTSPESMVTPTAREAWRKWKARLENAMLGGEGVNAGTAMSAFDPSEMQDTVGAVAWHSYHGMAAGVSSGGLLLKRPGRVGEAAIFGAGCWAQHCVPPGQKGGPFDGIACSVSGTGEHIIRANLARLVGETYRDVPNSNPHDFLQHILVEKFWKPARERGDHDPAAGILVITKESNEEGQTIARLWCAFTTPSMAIAFASGGDSRPRAYILRQPEGTRSKPEKPHVYITAFSL